MKFIFSLSVIAIGFFIFSCTTKEYEAVSNTEDSDEWPEMDAFHMTLAEAFHPLKDSGNVEPALRLIEQLADEADKWAATALPEKVDNEDMKMKLAKLKSDLHALSDEVKIGAPDDQVGASLFIIHDQFHEIMEAWHGAGVNQEHQEKH